jgi:hypothetical protein
MKNGGHIDRAMTNFSVAYQQGANAFIADKIFPIIRVTKQSDIYFSYSKADSFRDEVKERGQGAESAGFNWNVKEEAPYHCRKYALHYDITEEERVNYDQPINVDKDTVQFLTEKMLLNREIRFANTYFKTGVWGADKVGGTDIDKFSDPASSPVQIINDIMLEMAGSTGKKPNFAIMSPDVLYALKNHEEIMDRIKYTQKGIITLDLIAELFELDNIYVPWGIVNQSTNRANYDDSTETTDYIYKGSMLIGYRPPAPRLKEPSAGYIFSWTGLEGASAYGSRIVRIPMDMLGLGTERIEAEMAYDMKVICKDMGVFLTNLV